MRTLFVCPDMRTGGAERHWATLTPALANAGLAVHVLCLSEEGGLFGALTEAGVPATCLHMDGRMDPRGWRRALGFARPGPDVVVSRGVSGQLVGAAIARRAGAPHVLNEHTPLRADGELLPPRVHQRLLTRLVAPRVDHVIAVTGAQLSPLTRLGYRPERLEVIPNGVFGDSAANGPPPDGEVFTVLCAARLEPEKGVGTFIQAVAAARRDEPHIRGLVAGDGPQRSELERMAEGSGVELLGLRRDVSALMASSHAVVLLSEAEALPMTVLEAMAAARPVVVSDIGGTAEAVMHGQTGMLVPPGDPEVAGRALADLAGDRERARRMGEAGRVRQRERFDGEAMVDRYARSLRRTAGVR